MARVVGIHGIGHQISSGPQLAAQWWPALVGGLEAAGRPEDAAALGRADVSVVFFGSLFRGPSERLGAPAALPGASANPESVPVIPEGSDEAVLIGKFYREAVRQDPSLELRPGSGSGPDPGPARPGLAVPGVQEMLARLLKYRALAGMAQGLFAGSLRQVTAYLNDPAVRGEVMDRAAQGIGTDTRVLIGHSLGSVVAYELLATGRYGQVRLLLTAGSPLGIPNVVFNKLLPAPVGGRGAWPGSVARWVNVADRRDVIALVKELAPLFPASGGRPPLEDYRVDNGASPHDALAYLNAAVTGQAVAGALSGPA